MCKTFERYVLIMHLFLQGTKSDVLESFISEDFRQSDWDGVRYEEEMKIVLGPLVEKYVPVEDTDFFSELPLADDTKVYDPYDIQNIFTIEPFRGTLLPYEYIVANIGFNPPPNVRIQAVVLCNIEGGEAERLVLRGSTAKLLYKFDRDKIDFKRKVRHL